MFQAKEVMSQERLDRYIEEAAKAAGYEEGFGARGCDSSLTHWWAVYVRQSLREQAENDRVADYLLECARLAELRGSHRAFGKGGLILLLKKGGRGFPLSGRYLVLKLQLAVAIRVFG